MLWLKRSAIESRRLVGNTIGTLRSQSSIRDVTDQEKLDYATRKNGITMNPEKYYPSIRQARDESGSVVRVHAFRKRFSGHDFSQYENKRFPGEKFIVEGKIKGIRKLGRAMYFIDVIQDDELVQVMASNRLMGMSKDEFDEHHLFFKKGDSILSVGEASVTNVGELTVKATLPVKMVSPCLNMIPNRLVDKKNINANRVLNYLVLPESKNPVLIKSWVTQSIRSFLLDREYVEVQTPILSGMGTGANAEPFVTKAKAISTKENESAKLEISHTDRSNILQLRVAPELWLKRLTIGGFDKVFEIGTNFRNEGVDATHNPEFTSCEFYSTFISLEDLMLLTEDMFGYIYTELSRRRENNAHLQRTLPYLHSLCKLKFKRVEFIPVLEELTGYPLPSLLTSSNLVEYYKDIGLPVPPNKSPANLLDYLSATYLERISSENPETPVFLYNQPAELSPLAKSERRVYNGRTFDISLRFELFIAGKEYVNAYEEENLPFAQLAKFQAQQTAKDQFADPELLIPDWEYIRAMELGLPPTGGWGCGVDRIAMLFSGSDRIDSVLAFGNVRDVRKQ